MCPFKRIQNQNRQSHHLIQGLEGLTAGASEHYDRLLWLTKPQSSSHQSPVDWLFDHVQTRLTLLELYRDYFPKQWDKSDADTRLLDLDVYTPRELEFFQLLDEHRFPCEYDDMTFSSYYSAYPLVPDWNEIDWLEWDCLVQCCVSLVEYFDWSDVLEQYKLQDKGFAKPAPLKQVSLSKLKALCQTLESPLRELHKAFNFIEHDTGNLWLDSHYTEPETLEWSHQSIERLTQTYKEARTLLQAFNELNDWLSSQPERIGLLVQLWNSAQIEPSSIQLELPFVTTISSEQWSTGTYMREFQANRQRYEQLVYGER